MLLAPLGALAIPEPQGRKRPPPGKSTTPDRATVVKPPPCRALVPAPRSQLTERRFDDFARDLLVRKSLTDAFRYVSASYKNNNPSVGDGPGAAIDALAPAWPNIQFSNIHTAFRGNTGWLSYTASGQGQIVDRFKWKSGCIVEHWDQGESFPNCNSATCKEL
ncbi:uncharacterized protein BCR38DRAFT_399678 [Pseudomassariella vexata]|uniref:SnoaL-like domain-containing protein n=1 Tax=Pseudomassariella vexata TaxID=1141098 RepID=A0A1Y2DHK6_9PEZI|nr:uncharacterized protein BCR38DRAFT_399678 [Pseudomassariella vexata]ORY58720.1 hypothetical protein BCR38DRAFT_399678 [Pseudomassariella vexata]